MGLAPDAVHLGDCITGMAEMPAGVVDLLITDPPFAIDFKPVRANYNRKAGRVLRGYREVEAADYARFSHDWLAAAHRLVKPDGSAFVFSGWNNLKDILVAAEETGWHTVNHIIWKYQFGVATRRRFVSSHYHCLYLCKDDKKRRFYRDARFTADARAADGGSLRYRDMEDVWVIKREYWQGDIKTPTKLPAELVRKILLYTSVEGDLVFDPFLGSGQVAVISGLEGRRYGGFEVVSEYHDFIKARLSSGQYRLKAGE